MTSFGSMSTLLEKIFPNHTQEPPLSGFPGISRGQLSRLVKERDLDYLYQHGGVGGIAKALDSDIDGGIKGDARDLRLRRSMFGSNTYSPPKFLLEALKDITYLMLLCAASLSLAIGIKRDGWKDGWYGGGALYLLLLLLFVAVVSVAKKFHHPKLNEIQPGQYVHVVRRKQWQLISTLDIVVGDVVWLEFSNRVPADGLIMEGYSLGLELYPEMGKESKEVVSIDGHNPFLFAHSKVVHGEAPMLVTSVGLDTLRGEILGSNEHKKSLLASALY